VGMSGRSGVPELAGLEYKIKWEVSADGKSEFNILFEQPAKVE
jgi:hypothetical protein